MSNPKRIVWMMDETIADTHPDNWEGVFDLEKQLVDLIGKEGLQHDVVHPIPCLNIIVDKIRNEKPSCIVDLTGWLTPALKEVFPKTSITREFAMSRVRCVSDPELATTGYYINRSPGELAWWTKNLDKSNPLIVDDVSFSGWSSRKTMEIFGFKPEHTTHAFLIANTGMLGKEKGAVKSLESLGGRVFFGHEMTTPEEDGWHLKDLHNHASLAKAFSLSVKLQELFSRDGKSSEAISSFLKAEGVTETLFPNKLTSNEVESLCNSGKFILLNDELIQGNLEHEGNPLLWTSSYFQQHISIDKLVDNQAEIQNTLLGLQSLKGDKEARKEAELSLAREAVMVGYNKEGDLAHGKERS